MFPKSGFSHFSIIWSIHIFIFSIEIAFSTKRTDIVFGSLKQKKKKKGFVSELTVPFEENFDCAQQHKLEKSENLQEQCVRNGWITNALPIEVRCRGFIANSTSVFLTFSDKRKYMEKTQDKALTESAWIWQSHRVTTIWQSLVVSWDTAGALWTSGNDASAPKPYQNPESSFDEGFVGNSTVVQTSVIVWYLLYKNSKDSILFNPTCLNIYIVIQGQALSLN